MQAALREVRAVQELFGCLDNLRAGHQRCCVLHHCTSWSCHSCILEPLCFQLPVSPPNQQPLQDLLPPKPSHLSQPAPSPISTSSSSSQSHIVSPTEGAKGVMPPVAKPQTPTSSAPMSGVVGNHPATAAPATTSTAAAAAAAAVAGAATSPSHNHQEQQRLSHEQVNVG